MRCYLCEQPISQYRNGTVRDNTNLRIVECSSCGLVALSSSDHIQPGHYENSGMHGDSISTIKSLLNGAERDDKRRFEMLRENIENKLVLDFGCGAGGFLCKAEEIASMAAGVEVERRMLDYWKGRLQLHANLESVVDVFDFITAFHVIEHLPDPRTTLVELRSRLADGGRVVVEVPNSEDALLTLYECDAFQHFTYWSQHIFLFNSETLRRLATQAGYRVVAIQQYQRYPLSNHLHWLARQQPNGHKDWSFLDSPIINQAYGDTLAAIGKCDTLIAHLECDNDR